MSVPAGSDGPAIGSTFAGHRIEALLGRGGMGVVFRARNLALDRDCALKILSPALSADPRFRERFRRESRLAASIDHPNVIPIHDAGEEDGKLYLSMRLVDGADLGELIAREGPLDPGRVAKTIGAVGHALDAAHSAGLIHRDVKPANVLVGAGADDGRIFLSDFGISRTSAGGETITRTGELIGSADYLAPEQIAGDPVDHRADLYALGAVSYFALTGKPPFARDTELATLFAHANAPRPRPSQERPGLAPALDAFIARAMAIDPADRPASGSRLAAELSAALDGGATVPLRTNKADRPQRRRWPWPLLAGGLVAVAAIAVVGLILASGGDDKGPPDGARGGGATASFDVGPEIRVGDGPSGLSVGDERVWVAAGDAGQVDPIDLATGKRDPAIAVPSPTSVAVGHGSVWVASKADDALYRLDPAEGIEPLRIDLGTGAAPADVAVDDRWVWVVNEGANTLVRIDPDRPDAQPAIEELGTPPRAVASDGRSVWVTNIDDSSVTEVDAATVTRTGTPIQVDELPSDIAVGEDAVWVISNLKGTLSPIDPDNAVVEGDPIAVGERPRGVKAGLGFVWVALGGEDAVVLVDPDSLTTVGEPLRVGRNPSDIALGTDSAWVSNQDDATVNRIDP